MTSTELVPPQNLQAEQAVLGACLLSASAFADARRSVAADDWYRPAHALIWDAMRAVADAGQPVDALTVGQRLAETGQLTHAGGATYLHTLLSGVVTAANVGFHANLVVAAAIRRRLIQAGERIVQRAYEADGGDLDEILRDAGTELDLVHSMRATDGVKVQQWGAFIDQHAGRPENWVVQNCIGRKDVWMILAPAGAGKTTLSRMVCWAVAAGVNPWNHTQRVTAQRTLLVDLENDEGMAADESIDWYRRYEQLRDGLADRAAIWSKPEGMNLRKLSHEWELDDVLLAHRPSFVALGSLYKAYNRTGDWDQCANEAREALDRLRKRHQVAFWLEHHMPKGQDGGKKPTPFGSSVWEWWSSHGRVLERATPNPNSPFRFSAPFRGDRGRRETPVGFTRGGRYPWTAVMDDDELDVLIEASQ